MLRRLFYYCAHKQRPDGHIEYRDGTLNVALPINPKTFSGSVRGHIAQGGIDPVTRAPYETWDSRFILDSLSFVTDYEDTPEATP